MNKLGRLVRDHGSTITAIIVVVVFSWIQHRFTNDVMIRGNYGLLNRQIREVLDISVLILLGTIAKLFVYKYLHTWGSGKGATTGRGAGFLSLIVTGCPACSITLASYLGLSAFISWLPYDGLELKILSVLLMWYAIFDLWKNLDVCAIKIKNVKSKKQDTQ